MATIDTRDQYKFCTIPQDLVCASSWLMPRRANKRLLVGCDIGFLMEGAAERHRIADARLDSMQPFYSVMDKHLRRQRIVDVAQSMVDDVSRDVGTNISGRTLGAFIDLPYGTIFETEQPLTAASIQQAFPQTRINANQLVDPNSITNALEQKPIEDLMYQLRVLNCCERHSPDEISTPDYTNVVEDHIYKGQGAGEPTITIDTDRQMYYEQNIVVIVRYSDDKEEALNPLNWTTVKASREFFEAYEQKFTPFLVTTNVPAWCCDLIDSCVAYAQVAVDYWKITTEPSEDGKWQTSFTEPETKNFYWPIYTERVGNSWLVTNYTLQQAINAIKDRVGVVDINQSTVFKDQDILACRIKIQNWMPVYYLTDRTIA